MTGIALTYLAQHTSPRERIQGASAAFSQGSGHWLWLVIIIAALVCVAVLVWGVVSYIQGRKRHAGDQFTRMADQLGLSEEERALLFNIARHSHAPSPELIFSSESSFNEGVAAMTTDNSVGGDANPLRMCGSCTYIQTLREKMGFSTNVEHGRPTTVNLGKIPAGTILTIMRQRSPEHFQAAVMACDERSAEIEVQPEVGIETKLGESWLVRFPEGGILWEFNGWITKTAETAIVLKASGTLRWINRRRFVRTATSKPAYLATFPFDRTAKDAGTPTFVRASLIEIAGPGLLLRAPVRTKTGERVLVVLELHRNKIVEAMGTVRRATEEPGTEEASIAVELVGLTTSEIADLAKETHMAQVRDDEPIDEALAAAGELEP